LDFRDVNAFGGDQM